MDALLENKILLLAMTLGLYYAAGRLQKLVGSVLLNPILVTVLIIIAYLKLSGVSYENYMSGSGHYIDFLLAPSIVAFGLPLYEQLRNIYRQLLPILLSQLVGCVVGVVSVVLIADWLGAENAVILSLSPKSVTTPIAMAISKSLGGIVPLTAVVVICVGIMGAIFGMSVYRLCGIRNPISQALGMGAAAHAVGTSQMMLYSSRYGAFSTIGLIFNGVLTALLAPYILQLLGYV